MKVKVQVQVQVQVVAGRLSRQVGLTQKGGEGRRGAKGGRTRGLSRSLPTLLGERHSRDAKEGMQSPRN